MNNLNTTLVWPRVDIELQNMQTMLGKISFYFCTEQNKQSYWERMGMHTVDSRLSSIFLVIKGNFTFKIFIFSSSDRIVTFGLKENLPRQSEKAIEIMFIVKERINSICDVN